MKLNEVVALADDEYLQAICSSSCRSPGRVRGHHVVVPWSPRADMGGLFCDPTPQNRPTRPVVERGLCVQNSGFFFWLDFLPQSYLLEKPATH